MLTSTSAGGSSSFAYDAAGRRTQLTAGTTTTSYLYVGANAVQEIQGGAVIANQVPALGVDEDPALEPHP
jgi:YD repeat-containing protein